MQMVNDKLVASHQNILKTYSQGDFLNFGCLYFDLHQEVRLEQSDIWINDDNKASSEVPFQ